jgi:hypothetical protein
MHHQNTEVSFDVIVTWKCDLVPNSIDSMGLGPLLIKTNFEAPCGLGSTETMNRQFETMRRNSSGRTLKRDRPIYNE